MKIGVVGGGQLGRMLALSGVPMGMQFSFLDPAVDACAADTGDLICADYSSDEGLRQLIESSDVVTFEFESIPPATVAQIGDFRPVFPSAEALDVARDRWQEKSLFSGLGIEIAPVHKVGSQQDLEDGVAAVGLPAVLKTRTLGYDGKGQKVLKSESDVAGAYAELGSVPMILEGFISFDFEVSCIGVRRRNGDTAFYPLSRNEHRQSMLYRSDALVNHPLQQLAEDYVKKVMDALSYVGVLSFEFFVCGNRLIANEIAPRVHNSGHWTIEGAVTSQFENHIRAISDLPLGSPAVQQSVTLFNVIGCYPDYRAVLGIPGAHYHSYAKQAKTGRKIGHITVVSADEKQHQSSCAAVEALLCNQL